MDESRANLIVLPDVVGQFFNILLETSSRSSVEESLLEFQKTVHKSTLVQHRYLFDQCFSHFSEILRLANPENVTCEILSTVMESCKEELQLRLDSAVGTLRQKSVSNLYSDFEFQIATIYDTLKNIFYQSTRLHHGDIENFFDNILRLKSYSALSGTTETALLRNNQDIEINYFNNLDIQFRGFLLGTYSNLDLLLFKDENTEAFKLLANKIELLHSNAIAQVLFPSTFKTLEELRHNVKASAITTLQQLKNQREIALEKENFLVIQSILNTLRIGDIQVTGLFSEYDSVHRDYVELYDYVEKYVENLSTTLLEEVQSPPFASVDYHHLFGSNADVMISTLKEVLQIHHVIDAYGHYNSNWNGNINYPDCFSLPVKERIQQVIDAKLSECSAHIIRISSVLERQLKNLCELAWFDEFRESVALPSRFSISSTLALIKEGCSSRSRILEQQFRKLTTSGATEFSFIQMSAIDLISLQRFSKTINLDIDCSFLMDQIAL